MKRLHTLFLCAIFVSSACCATAAEPVGVEGYTHVKSMGGIDEYRLDANGLTVLVMPNPAVPVVSFQVTYLVGSRNEVTGSTGSTHLLEHLMFKGSKHFNDAKGNGGNAYLERAGANFNATTYLDRTNYYATLGLDALEDYIAIEADRMRNLLLDEKMLKDEMTVVRNEFERDENEPARALGKQIYATVFQAHPYHHSTIGWRSDIENVPMSKLREFYDTFYWPNNATITLVGNIDTRRALQWVKKYYGAIPRSPAPIPQVYTTEPKQEGPRRTELRRAGASGVVEIAYRGVSARDPDAAALSVLGLVLSQDKTSRLYRALVDRSLAVDVSAGPALFHDPGIFDITVAMTPDARHAEVERILLEEIARVRREGVTADEIRAVLGPYRASLAYQRDGTGAAVMGLNEAIAQGDWSLFVTFPEALEKVTPADVRRVAARYLVEDQSTTGWFVPEEKSR
ncbi:insulinase family protein [Lysobacter pythonis]|uniref:Insulinase family protein n=1 Tax=Solilutibacter pythonis TaxID=2483112 RepID=A0A3M2I3T2_9GAMM|nr:pitrilysin family protein [Lysobacter pythonis]RMH92884.1 insulinase family protein [Lysobacter pythonis]